MDHKNIVIVCFPCWPITIMISRLTLKSHAKDGRMTKNPWLTTHNSPPPLPSTVPLSLNLWHGPGLSCLWQSHDYIIYCYIFICNSSIDYLMYKASTNINNSKYKTVSKGHCIQWNHILTKEKCLEYLTILTLA